MKILREQLIKDAKKVIKEPLKASPVVNASGNASISNENGILRHDMGPLLSQYLAARKCGDDELADIIMDQIFFFKSVGPINEKSSSRLKKETVNNRDYGYGLEPERNFQYYSEEKRKFKKRIRALNLGSK